MQVPFVLGVTGGSASGKTHFLKQLLAQLRPEDVCLMPADNYYKTIDQVPLDANGIQNFDLPAALDSALYRQHIEAVKDGQTIQKQEYTFNNPNVVPKMLTFSPAPIILIEGIFVFYFAEVAKLIDLKVFVDAQEHIKLKRRIQRDAIERGYDLDDVLYRYEHHVAPTYDLYVKPGAQEADIVINNNASFDRALEVLSIYLQAKVAAWHRG